MFVAESLCNIIHVGDFFRYDRDFSNVLNRSPTSRTCHQQIWPSTSVININVTILKVLP